MKEKRMENETPAPKEQKIIRLSVSNLMRVTAVEIRPEDGMVVIGGDNGAGKSSVLDAIWFALGGTKNICEQPIHRGKTRAEATVELSDYVVTRAWTAAGGSTLRVTTKDGTPMRAPQDILNGLIGQLSFDPMEFGRLAEKEPRKAVDILKNVVGLDFTELDGKKTTAFAQRTDINRQLDQARVKATGYTKDATAPDKEVSTAELVIKLTQAQETNLGYQKKRQEREETLGKVGACNQNITNKRNEIADIKRQIEDLKGKICVWEQDIAEVERGRDVHAKAAEALTLECDDLADVDEQAIKNQITGADEVNKKVRNNARLAELEADVTRLFKQSAELTTAIEAADKAKADTLAKAKFPIKEISFDDNGVLLDGVPWNQGSTAERIRASLALGMALNPQLKVIIIREGSLLDEKSLVLVANMAKERDFQIWMERVGNGEECQFIIVDGHLEGVEAK